MQNFGYIKNAFNEVLVEAIIKKDGTLKAIFQKYVKAIKESKILKTQYLVYTNIESKLEESEFKASQYINENISLLKSFDKDEIVKENETLIGLLDKAIELSNIDYDKRLEELHDKISSLVFNEKTAEQLDEHLNAVNYIVEYIQTNEKIVAEEKETLVPTNILTTIAVDKYNEKYSDLSESEKEIVKVILEGNDETKEKVFNDTLNSCVELVNTQLKETEDLDTKDKLLSVKEKLLNTKFIEESFISEVSKLIELKNDLSNNIE